MKRASYFKKIRKALLFVSIVPFLLSSIFVLLLFEQSNRTQKKRELENLAVGMVREIETVFDKNDKRLQSFRSMNEDAILNQCAIYSERYSHFVCMQNGQTVSSSQMKDMSKFLIHHFGLTYDLKKYSGQVVLSPALTWKPDQGYFLAQGIQVDDYQMLFMYSDNMLKNLKNYALKNQDRDFILVYEDRFPWMLLNTARPEQKGQSFQSIEASTHEKGRQVYTIEHGFQNEKLKLYVLDYNQSFFVFLQKYLELSFFILIVIGMSAFLFSDYIAKAFSKPFQKILNFVENVNFVSNTKRIEETDLSLEMHALTVSINSMLDKIDHLNEQIAQETESRLTSEVNFLQSQIKPHFIFNALQEVNSLIRLGLYEEADAYIMRFSTLLRYVMTRSGNYLRLEEELMIIESTLALHGLRFGDSFDYDIEVDSGLEDFKILKLSIQPLVENALIHGLSDKNPRVKIRVFAEDRDLWIQISDNAEVYPYDLFEIFQEIAEMKNFDLTDGLGITNIYKRLRLTYGDDFDFYCDRDADWTHVLICLKKVLV